MAKYKKRGDKSGDPKEIAIIYLKDSDKDKDKEGYMIMRAIKKALEPSEAKALYRDLGAGYILQDEDFKGEIKELAKKILAEAKKR